MYNFFKGRGLKEGENVNGIVVSDSAGQPVDLAALSAEGAVVLWFYPKSNTSGCTAQGKNYSTLNPEFAALGVHTFGVSHEHSDTQCNFLEVLGGQGQLVPDPSGELAKTFGVAELLGLFSRDTILIRRGVVEKIWRNVNPFVDTKTVLDYLKA